MTHPKEGHLSRISAEPHQLLSERQGASQEYLGSGRHTNLRSQLFRRVAVAQ
nr:MAG TPA: hypothetical protein [Caudoviricetes sp.]